METPEQRLYEQTKICAVKAQETYDKAVNSLTTAIRSQIPSMRRIQAARRAVARAEKDLAYWKHALIDAEMRL